MKTELKGEMKMNKSIMLISVLLFSIVTVISFTPIAEVKAYGDSLILHPGYDCGYLGTSSSTVETNYVKSSVFQDTMGDFQLIFTLTSLKTYGVRVYVPSAFIPPVDWESGDTSNIWSSFTNDYGSIEIKKLDEKNSVAPNWYRLTFYSETGFPPGTYEVRLFDMTAPSVLGRYHFKFGTSDGNISEQNRTLDGSPYWISNSWKTFPTVVVKGERNPAYITGTVKLREYYGASPPVNVAGKVVAEGTTVNGRSVRAEAYFNKEQSGKYQLLGLPAGVYTLRASADGYPTVELGRQITLTEGQSLHDIDLFVDEGPTISVRIWSKCKDVGPVKWGRIKYGEWSGVLPTEQNRTVNLEVYKDSELVAFSPYPFPTTNYNLTYFDYTLNSSMTWTGYVPYDTADYIDGFSVGTYSLKAHVVQYTQRGDYFITIYPGVTSVSREMDMDRMGYFKVTVHFRDSLTGPEIPTTSDKVLILEALDYSGNVRAWNITKVPSGSKNYTMTLHGIWSSTYPFSHWYWRHWNDAGMPEGSYLIKAYIVGYYQPTISGASISYCGKESKLSFTLLKGASVSLTVRSVDWETPPQPKPWSYDKEPIRVEFFDSSGTGHGYNVTEQNSGTNYVTIPFEGMSWVDTPVSYWKGEHDTSLPSDSYTIRGYTPGYIQTTVPGVYLNAPAMSDISMNLVIGATIYMNIGFRTEEIITPTKEPRFIRVLVVDSKEELRGTYIGEVPSGIQYFTVPVIGFDSYYGTSHVCWNNYYTASNGQKQKDYGLPADTYTIYAYIEGYYQRSVVIITVTLSGAGTVNFDEYELAYIHGNVWTYDHNGNILPLSWAKLSLTNEETVYSYSLDGAYDLYSGAGTYRLITNVPPYFTQFEPNEQGLTFVESALVGFSVYLVPTGVPIPEFPEAGVLMLISALAASLYLLKWRKRAIQPIP